jgi:hypothetical protein
MITDRPSFSVGVIIAAPSLPSPPLPYLGMAGTSPTWQ